MGVRIEIARLVDFLTRLHCFGGFVGEGVGESAVGQSKEPTVDPGTTAFDSAPVFPVAVQDSPVVAAVVLVRVAASLDFHEGPAEKVQPR